MLHLLTAISANPFVGVKASVATHPFLETYFSSSSVPALLVQGTSYVEIILGPIMAVVCLSSCDSR